MAARLLAWAGVLLAILGSFLLLPRARGARDARPALHAVLLDASASVARRAPGRASFAREVLRAEAQAARAAGAEIALVVYGADVALVFEPGAPEELLARLDGPDRAGLRLELDPPADAGSELARALALVARELAAPDRAAGTLTLVGDRSATGPDPMPALERLSSAGIALRFIDAPPPELPNLALEALRLPAAPVPGEALAATAELALWPGRAALDELRAKDAVLALEVELETADNSARFELPIAWPAVLAAGPDGALRFALSVPLGAAPAGRALVRARARLTAPGALRAGDPVPEDDRAWAACRAGDARVALAVARDEDHALVRELVGGSGRFPALEWHVLAPRDLPGFAGGADLVATFDLGPEELPAEHLVDFVRGGGGWLACGGWGMLAFGGRTDELSALLPLRPASSPPRERDVVFLVDGSGSMAGEPFERVREALARLVLAAPEGDRLQLRFFTATLLAPQYLEARTPAERERATRTLIATRVPGGDTAILYSLEALAKERTGEREALVVMLTDGKDRTAFDVEARGAAVREALLAKRAELAVIAIGADADREILGALLPPGGELRIAADLGDLSELFQSELMGERLREGEALSVVPAEPGALEDLPLAAEVVRAELARPRADWPAGRRFVRAEEQPGAAVLWRDDEGAPLLALARAGAGIAAAWASWPAPAWSPEWARADDLLGPLYRALARPPRAEPGLALEVRSERVVLSGLGPGAPPRVEARFVAATAGGALEVGLGSIELAPPAAGSDVRRERWGPRPDFLASAPAGAPLRVALRGLPDGVALGSIVCAAPRPTEFDGSARPIAAPASGASPGGPRPDSSTPDPRGPFVLAGGLAALALAALLGAFGAGIFPGAGGGAKPGTGRSRAAADRPKGGPSRSAP